MPGIKPTFFFSAAINGRAYGNLDGLEMCKGDKVVWHLLGLGGNEALHVPVFNGNNLRIYGINRDSHVLIPEMTWTGMMVADNVGKYRTIFEPKKV